MPNTIWNKILPFKAAYEKQFLKMNPSYAKNQQEILNLVDYYWMNKYRDGEYDNSGFKKAFYNIVLNPTETAQKFIDFDTKDILIIAEEGQSYYPAWFFSKDLNIWMKDNKNKYGQTFGQQLNQFVYKLPKYGHLLLKKAKDTVHLVPLQNVINKQDARCILESDLIIEKHDYTPSRLRKENWDNVEAVIKKYEKDGIVSIFEIQGDITGETNNYWIMPDGGLDEEIMFFDKKDRNELYKELKWDEVEGRAMGRGIVERLFEAQIAKNQTENFLRVGMRWSSKHIFQTKDDTVAKNLLKQIENGDIMTILSEITPVSVEERNLPAYNISDQKWDKNVADLTFAYSQVRGERPPAGTPLGTSILQTNLAVQFYDLKREDLGMFIKDVLYDWIIPSFQNQKKGIHQIMMGEFEEEELDKLRNLLLTNRSNRAILNYIARNLKLPSSQEAEIIKAIEKEKLVKSRSVEIPKKYYEDLKYKIKIILTNEQIDVAARMTTLQTVLAIVGSNPTILKDPRTRKVFYKLIDLAGFSPIDFGVEEPESLEQLILQQIPQVAGSMPRPRIPAQPQQTTETLRL